MSNYSLRTTRPSDMPALSGVMRPACYRAAAIRDRMAASPAGDSTLSWLRIEPRSCDELRQRIPRTLELLELPFLDEVAIGEHEHTVELARKLRA